MRIRLPLSTGLTVYEMNPAGPVQVVAGPPCVSRIAYAAAHVVVDPATRTASGELRLDLDATLSFRRYLWSLGFHVAEAMDTAQRGMGLTWPVAKALIRLSCAEARSLNAGIACGANTDQLTAHDLSLSDVAAAYQEQCEWIEQSG